MNGTKPDNIPTLDYLTYAKYKINLQEEQDIFSSQLLEVQIGTANPFSPDSRYLLYPPESTTGIKDFLTVDLGIYKVLFKTKIDEIGNIIFYSYNYPGYAVKRSGKNLVVIDFNESKEYVFASFDGGRCWKLELLRERYAPERAIKCQYSNDGLIESIILPGARAYKIDYKYGQAVRVTSPSGAITTFNWSEAGTLAEVKTVLTEKHPFYKMPQEKKSTSKKDKNKGLCVVRDLFVQCNADGRLIGLITDSGEKYTAEYISDLSPQKTVLTGILTFPNGTKKFKTNTNTPGRRISVSGVIVAHEGNPQFIPQSSTVYVSQNGVLAFTEQQLQGTSVRCKREAGTLAITEMIDSVDNITKFQYNRLGLRTMTIFPDNSRSSQEYDEQGNLVKATDECGRIETWKRNNNGKLLEYAKGDLIAHYNYNSFGYPSQTILLNNLNYIFEWDGLGRIIAATRPDGVKTVYSYYGNLSNILMISLISADGKTIYDRKFSYDIYGRLSRISYSDDTYEAFMYDCCNMIAQRSRAGAITKYKYNQNHDKVQEISSTGEITAYEYDKLGRLAKTIDSKQAWTSYFYNQYDKIIGEAYSNGSSVQFILDKQGRRIKEIKSDGTAIQTRYNNRNRIAEITSDIQRNVSYVYDCTGNVLNFADYGTPAGQTPLVTEYVYDTNNHRVREINSEGIVSETKYISGSTLIDYVKTNKIYHFNSYNSKGQLIAVSEVTQGELDQALTQSEKQQLLMSKRIEVRTYDGFGNLAEVRNGKGEFIKQYTYQPDGTLESTLRPLSIDHAELLTYNYSYSDDGEKIFSVYKKIVPYSSQPKTATGGPVAVAK